MSIPVPCPKCGLVLKAPDDSAGRKARCKKCGEKFRIPGTVSVDQPVVLDESIMLSSFDFSEPIEGGLTRKAKAGGRGPIVLAMIVGGLFLALCVAAGGVFVWQQYADKQAAAKAEMDKVNQERKAEERTAQKQTDALKKEKGRDREKQANEIDESPKSKIDPTALPEEKAKGGMPGVRVTGAPAPAAPGENAKVISKAPTIVAVPYEPASVQSFIINSSGNRMAIARKTFAGFQGKGALRTVDILSYPVALKLSSIEVPSDLSDSIIALAPGDGWLVSETKPGCVTMWNSSLGKQKFENVELFKTTSKGAFLVAIIAGDESLLAMGPGGVVMKVAIKDDQPVVTTAFTPGKTFSTDFVAKFEVNCTIPSDGKIACFGVGQAVHAASLTSGSSRVEWTLPVKPTSWAACELDAGGNRIACVVKLANGSHRCLVGRLGTEKAIVNAPVPTNIGDPVHVTWFGEIVSIRTDDGTRVLYDCEAGGYVGVIRTSPSPIKQITILGGERLIASDADPKNPKQFRLLDIEFPFDGYFPLRDQALGDKKPLSLRFSETGMVN